MHSPVRELGSSFRRRALMLEPGRPAFLRIRGRGEVAYGFRSSYCRHPWGVARAGRPAGQGMGNGQAPSPAFRPAGVALTMMIE